MQLHFSQKKSPIAHQICLNLSRLQLLLSGVYRVAIKNPDYSTAHGMIPAVHISVFSIRYASYVGSQKSESNRQRIFIPEISL